MDDDNMAPWVRVGRDERMRPRGSPPKTSVAIGFGSPAQDSGVSRLDLNDVLVRNPQATFLMRAGSRAMHAAGIDPSDLILVDRAIEAQHGHIVIAVADNEFVCRRLVRDGAQLSLKAEGEGVDITPRDGEELRLWGVVTTVIKALPV